MEGVYSTFSFTTDNGAMIAITGYYKYLNKDFCDLSATSYARVTFDINNHQRLCLYHHVNNNVIMAKLKLPKT